MVLYIYPTFKHNNNNNNDDKKKNNNNSYCLPEFPSTKRVKTATLTCVDQWHLPRKHCKAAMTDQACISATFTPFPAFLQVHD